MRTSFVTSFKFFQRIKKKLDMERVSAEIADDFRLFELNVDITNFK